MDAPRSDASEASTPIPIPIPISSQGETSNEPFSVPFSWGTGSAPSVPAADTDEESSVSSDPENISSYTSTLFESQVADYDSAIGGLSNVFVLSVKDMIQQS
jgi:hypothetical protein